MSRYLRKQLASLRAYVPGEQPQDRQFVKLNTNESPYPPPPEVEAAVNGEEIRALRLYNDPACTKLKEALAKTYGVETENVFVSNGSDEALNFAFLAYGENGAAFPDITYGFYSVFAALYGISADVIPLTEDFRIDTAMYDGKNNLIVIANPNAPTGLLLPITEIERIVSKNPGGVVVIDEAYIDFGGTSAVELTKRYENLLVIQTFSKSRSMAGARLGFAIGHRDLIADLERIKYSTNPYNVDRLTQAAGRAALQAAAYYRENCFKIMETREYMKKELADMGFLQTDSMANFVFVKHEKIGGQALYLALKERGVLVRHFDQKRIQEYNRITVGSREEADLLLAALREIKAQFAF